LPGAAAEAASGWLSRAAKAASSHRWTNSASGSFVRRFMVRQLEPTRTFAVQFGCGAFIVSPFTTMVSGSGD